MIQFRNLSLNRGARTLVADVSLQIHAGWRVGVVGANGSGKSSVFALLRGELHPETGDLELPPAWRIASVAQETPALEQPALEYVLDGDIELREIEGRLAAAEANHDGRLVAECHERLLEIDGYSAPARAASLLAGLGFAAYEQSRPVSAFSGGWRMRLNLAQALISRSDLMLLDEPTNHLDLDAVLWLEKWLTGYRGTLLLISHDREFLDAITTHTAHLNAQRMTLYTGNYSAFEAQRATQLAVQQALYEKQQREIAHLERFIERFRAKATKARQAQSRLKALDRMERVAAAHVDAPFDFAFPEPARAPDPLLTLDRVAAGYGERVVLQGVNLTLRPGVRLGLLGANGAGKSTFIKLLAGAAAGGVDARSGSRVEGRGLAVGYFAQHQLEQLRDDESPLRHLQREFPDVREQDLRDYLGGFDFRGSMADAPVGPFSGGERARLALALLVRRRPNLLLLDEPTNHLDLDMRHALTRALAEYEGSLVLVSHDRTLLRTVCDEFLLVHDGQARPFDGDLDDYVAWLAERRAAEAPASTVGVDGKAARKEARAAAAAERQTRLAERRALIKEAGVLERQIAGWQAEKETIDRRLADPAFYSGPDTALLRELTTRQSELQQLIDAAEHRWLEAQEQLEQIGDV